MVQFCCLLYFKLMIYFPALRISVIFLTCTSTFSEVIPELTIRNISGSEEELKDEIVMMDREEGSYFGMK